MPALQEQFLISLDCLRPLMQSSNVWQMPRATITALVVLLGVYVLVDAVISVANGAAMRGVAGSRLMVVWGVLGGIIAIGAERSTLRSLGASRLK